MSHVEFLAINQRLYDGFVDGQSVANNVNGRINGDMVLKPF